MQNPVIILGIKTLGIIALDIFQSNDVAIYGMLDENENKENRPAEIDGISVLGNVHHEGYLKLIGNKCEAFVAIDDNEYKKNITEMLLKKRNTMPVNAIHAKAHLSHSASIGHGNLIAAGVYLQPQASIGHHCILHCRSIIETDVKIDNFVQIGAGAVIGAGVQIAEGAFIGAGANIVAGVQIGKNARIGAGSVVIDNVAPKQTVFGNPAKKVS
ncbi:MAG: acetyltransferase [Cytophagales bacterium]|nr:MAG: acetyltransferase [Cytophagales bacterium]